MRYCLFPEQNNQNILGTLAGYSNRCSPFKRRITTLISLSPSPSPLGCECSSLCVSSGSPHFCPRIPQRGRQLFGCAKLGKQCTERSAFICVSSRLCKPSSFTQTKPLQFNLIPKSHQVASQEGPRTAFVSVLKGRKWGSGPAFPPSALPKSS